MSDVLFVYFCIVRIRLVFVIVCECAVQQGVNVILNLSKKIEKKYGKNKNDLT